MKKAITINWSGCKWESRLMHEHLAFAGGTSAPDPASQAIKTEEITDIIGRMPTAFGRWIAVTIVFLVVLLAVFGNLIKYPDVLRGQVTISATHAPIKLKASTSGRLQLIHLNSAGAISAKQYIAFIKNPASTDDVRLVDSLLNEINISAITYDEHRKFFPQNVALGELSEKYFSFLNSLYQYLDYYRSNPFGKQKRIIGDLTDTRKSYHRQDKDEYERLKNKYMLASSLFKRETILFDQKVISAAELEQAHVALITSEQAFRAIDKGISTDQYQIKDAGSQMEQVEIQRIEKERTIQVELVNGYFRILEAIRQWEHEYVFVAPISGQVEFLNFWKNDDYIQTGEEAFSIIPPADSIYGKVFMPEQGRGKIKPGQQAIIKLDAYPYSQYGSVKGIVKTISAVTNQQTLSSNQQKVNAYLITIALPSGLKTNYGSNLPLTGEAGGIAEIVTSDRSLIERLFDNIKPRIN